VRKIDRHRLNVETHGSAYCARQVEVTTCHGLLDAIQAEHVASRNGRVGIRSDWPPGGAPDGAGLGKLPFRPYLTRDRAYLMGLDCLEKGLTVIVAETFRPDQNTLNVNAIRLDREHVFMECSGGTTERDMGRDPSQLRRFVVGPSGCCPVPWLGDEVLRCFDPFQCRQWRLDTVYEMTLVDPAGHLVASYMNPPGRLVLW